MTTKIQEPRGYLKFSSRVDSIDIENFAKELAADPRFTSVYIRKVSKDQSGIGFITKVNTSEQELFDIFADELKDRVMKQFGTGFAGWDMASSYFLIK
jgi:hypothetical protein